MKNRIRLYTVLAIIIAVVMCLAVLYLTKNNMAKYYQVSAKEIEKEQVLYQRMKNIETTENTLLNVCDSIVLYTERIVSNEDSVKSQFIFAIKKLDNINTSIKNVQLY